jgi:hypothetical protein
MLKNAMQYSNIDIVFLDIFHEHFQFISGYTAHTSTGTEHRGTMLTKDGIELTSIEKLSNRKTLRHWGADASGKHRNTLGITGFCTLSTVRYSKKHNV